MKTWVKRNKKKLAGLLVLLMVAGAIPLTTSIWGSDLEGEKQQVEAVAIVGGSWTDHLTSQAMWYLPVAAVGIAGIIIVMRKGGKKTDFWNLDKYGLPRS